MSGRLVLEQAGNEIRKMLFKTLKDIVLSSATIPSDESVCNFIRAADARQSTGQCRRSSAFSLAVLCFGERHVENRPPTFTVDGTT